VLNILTVHISENRFICNKETKSFTHFLLGFIIQLFIMALLRFKSVTIVLNVHAPRQDKNYNMKDRFYKELEHVFDKFPKYHMNIMYIRYRRYYQTNNWE
jgi:hypothetical protein